MSDGGAIHLSPRELEVTIATSHGANAREIAHRLGISATTVSKHLENVRQKTHAQSTLHAIATLLRQRIIE